MGRKEKKIQLQVEQLFIQHFKEVVFATPTLDALINVKLKNKWSKQSNTLNEWVNFFLWHQSQRILWMKSTQKILKRRKGIYREQKLI